LIGIPGAGRGTSIVGNAPRRCQHANPSSTVCEEASSDDLARCRARPSGGGLPGVGWAS
jgi:hypothetical protein